MEKSWNLTNELCILMNQGRYATAFQNPSSVYIDYKGHGMLEYSHGEVMESLWQPWLRLCVNHGLQPC